MGNVNVQQQVFLLFLKPTEVNVALVADGRDWEQEQAANELATAAKDKIKAREIVRNGGIRPLIKMLGRGNPPGQKAASIALRELARNKAHQVVISQACGIAPLLKLLEAKKKVPEGVKEEAAGCLAAVAANLQNQVAIGDTGVIPKLIDQLDFAGPLLKERLISLFWNLAYDAGNRRRLRDAGIIPILVDYLSEDYNNRRVLSGVLENSVGCLKLMAIEDDSKVMIVKEGGIQKLAWLLRHKGTAESRGRCIDVLGLLGELEEATRIFAKHEVMEGMVNLSDEIAPKMQYAIAQAIERIAWNDENRKLILQAGGTRVLAGMIKKGAAQLKAKACNAMYLLMQIQIGREGIAKDTAIDSLIKTLFSNDANVQLQGMRTLESTLLWPRNQDMFLSHGGLRVVVDRLEKAHTRLASAKAAGIIQRLAARPENHKELIRVGVVKPLADLMEDGHPEAQVKALGAISSIASATGKYIGQVYRAGAHPLIVPWLARGNFAGRAAAASALAAMAKENAYCKEILDAGALPLLVELLGAENGTPESNAAACKALSVIGMNSGCQLDIAKAGGIPSLIVLLMDGDLQVKEEAACTTWTMAIDAACRVSLDKAGAIAALIKILEMERPEIEVEDETEEEDEYGTTTDESDMEVIEDDQASESTLPEVRKWRKTDAQLMSAKAFAAGALATMAQNSDSRISIGRAGGVRQLVRLLVEGPPTAVAKAAGALWNLAADPNLRVEIGEAGAILPLVRLLDVNSERECRAKAKGCIWNLAIDPGNRTAIVAAGAIPPLVVLLTRGADEAKAKAAGCLWNLAVSRANQEAIVNEGAVRLLVDLLEKTFLEDARVCSAGALWNLALTDVGRSRIGGKGTNELLNIVRRCSGVAQATAAGALRNMAADPMSQAAIQNAVQTGGSLPGLDQAGKTSGIEARLIRMNPL